MDDLRIGSVARALRIRRGWTQADLARAAGLSPATVSRTERGHLEQMNLAVLRRIFTALEARVELVPRWRGPELDRLLDERHAAMVESLLGRLSSMPDWTLHPEVTFSIYGERGSIDIVAWHPGRRALLVIEVKSAIGDVGGLVRQVDRYRRLAPQVARERGWVPVSVAVWVVLADGRTARRRLSEHRSTLRRAFPADGHAMGHWLRNPAGDLSALSFMPIGHGGRVGRGRRSVT